MDALKFVALIALPLIQFGFALQYSPGKSYHYNYSTQTAVNEANSPKSTKGQKDVGVTFSADVELTPIWNSGQEYLVKLQLSSPKLSSIVKGGKVSTSVKPISKSALYLQWEAGQVKQVYATEGDSTLAVNIKKGIASLLQLRTEEGQHTEIDVSGECTVTYKTEGSTITKTKTECRQLDTLGQYSSAYPLMSVSIAAQHETVYQLKDDIIDSAQSTEYISTSLPFKDRLTSSISVRQELKLASTGHGKTIDAPSIDDAVTLLSKGAGQELFGVMPLSVHEDQECTKTCTATKSHVAKYRKQLQQEYVGKEAMGVTSLELVELFRSTSEEAILDILKDEDNEQIVSVLVDILASVQTPASQRALMEFLNFQDESNIELPERYLLATAFVTHPTDALLKELLGLYRQNVASVKLRESIAEGLGAVTYTYCQLGDQCKQPLVQEIQEAMIEQLKQCEEESCKAIHLRSLSNAALPDTIPTLLHYAETGKHPTVSESAIKALRRMDHKYFDEELLNVLRRIFHQESRGYDTAVRTKALKYLLEAKPDLEQLRRIFMETRDPWETEFDLYVQATLFNLAERDETVSQMLKEILKDDSIRNYNILAPKGKSLAFTASLGGTDTMAVPYFMYVENTRAGLLKRSGMDVTVNSTSQTLPVYSFGIFASGLEGLVGTEEEAKEIEDTVATAGLSLDLMDISLRPVTFFEGGVGSLLSAVWNAPAELTSALQTNILLHDHLERLHLQNGLVAELQVQSALSIDLSGSLQFSMWNKNCQSLIKNSGSLVIQGSTKIASGVFTTGLDYTATMASVIDFESNVDFYDKVKMCLQMTRPDFVYRHHVKKYEHARGFQKGYVSHIRRSKKVNGVSFPMPKRNNLVCRELLVES